MAKAVEISFAIGAALTGGFTGAFGKAGQMLNQLQQQSSKLSQVTGQVSGYQKMEASITANQAAMTQAREQAKALETQITSSAQRTAQLQSQYRNSQAEIERLNAVLVRNKDAYEAARLKADSLKSQIQSSTGPTTELQRQYQAAQQEVRRLGDQVKQSSTQLKAAKDVSKQLGSEMKQSASQTKQLQREQKTLNDNAEKLQSGIKRDTEELAKMRSELSGAGVDTKNLAQEQARLEAQSQKAAAAQKKLADAQANYKSIKDQLSFSNIKNDLIASAGIMYSMYKPVMAAANFDEAMSGVKAVAFTGKDRTPEEAARSQAEFAQLREQALQLGADTQFTAIQAANSQENLARAGFKTKEIMAAMPPLLNMAAAEGMDLATAADIAASTLRGFNLDAEQTAHVADVLAQTSAASNTSIQGLGESMKYVAPVAAGLGISVEQTAAMLGIMGNAGIKGSQAGTALRAALTRLSKEPKKVADSLAELGVRAKDSQGRLRTMPSLMEELRQKLNGMGEGRQMQYLANIFGTEAAAGMLAIMRSTADGTLSELEYANKEASGIMKVLLDDVNKGLDKPIVTLEEMRAGMQKSEDQAKKLGISYNELASYLTVLAKQGIKGANADKALTTAFTQLQKQPKAMKQAFKKYNISAYTEGGMLKDFPDLLNEINKSMAGMKEADQLKALTQIFGKGTAESIRALMQGISDNSLDELKKKAEGVSEKMAKIRLDNLKGDLTILDSAWSGLQISVGKIFEPLAREGVQLLTTAISGLNETIKKFPKASKGIAYVIASLGALKVAKTVWKIGSALVRLPGAWLKVAGAAAEANAVLGKSTIIQKAWHGVMKAGSKLLDVGKLVLYYGKQILITTATKAWAAALKVWRIAMWAGSKLLSPVKLILYYSKQLLITTATKAWTAAQWLWNAALNANPIGLLITAIAGAIAIGYAMYKNWDKIKAWWNSWKVKDIFAVIKDYAS
ncbi:MAG: phage tail tape measure protein, partial [Synergistaceae bacterium]|nr:phage tail tape measure protein [Synergistaceae bacterium]